MFRPLLLLFGCVGVHKNLKIAVRQIRGKVARTNKPGRRLSTTHCRFENVPNPAGETEPPARLRTTSILLHTGTMIFYTSDRERQR